MQLRQWEGTRSTTVIRSALISSKRARGSRVCSKVAIDTGVDGIDVLFGTSSELRTFSHGKSVDQIIEAGTEVVRRLKWPGPFGLGHRYFYLLKKQVTDGSPPNPAPPDQKRN